MRPIVPLILRRVSYTLSGTISDAGFHQTPTRVFKVQYIKYPTLEAIQEITNPADQKHQKSSDSNHGHSSHGGHGHDFFSTSYYSTALVTIIGGSAYAIFSGDAKEALEDMWHKHNPPEILKDVEFGAFVPHQEIPVKILEQLKRRFLSSQNQDHCKRVVICGAGGIGKLATAMHIAKELDNQNNKPHFRTTINLRGHSRGEIEEDIIKAAIQLGINEDEPVIDSQAKNQNASGDNLIKAKKFLASDLQKRPGTNIIVRCLRDPAILREVEDIIFPPQILPTILSVKVSLIVTTGEPNIEKELKQKNYDTVSLNKSFTQEDLRAYFLKTDPTDYAILKAGTVSTMILIKDTFQNNPTLARIAIAYFKQNPTLTVQEYRKGLDLCQANNKEEAILKISLNQLHEKYPLAKEILAMIAPIGTPQSAGLVVENLLQDEARLASLFKKVSVDQKDKEHIVSTLNALERYGLINVNAIEGKIYQTILISQSNYLRGEPATSQSSFRGEAGKNTDSFLTQLLRHATGGRS